MANEPREAMTREQLEAARDARSSTFGIEVLESGSALTFPKGFPMKLGLYADPVNLKYPVETVARARNARVRFKQFAANYKQDTSKKVVHTRIVKAELGHGVKPSYDPEDALDKMLPPMVVRQIEDVVKSEVTEKQVRIQKVLSDEDLCNFCENVADLFIEWEGGPEGGVPVCNDHLLHALMFLFGDPEEEKTITSPDLAGGGKKNPARYPGSYLDDEDKHIEHGVVVSKMELEHIESGSEHMLCRLDKCMDIHTVDVAVVHENMALGVARFGPAFEMTWDEVERYKSLHYSLAEVDFGDSSIKPDRAYGYMMRTFKKFEVPVMLAEQIKNRAWSWTIPVQFAEIEDIEKSLVDIKVIKQNEERVVAAAVLVPDIPDLHGDQYDGPTVRMAAYYFMEHYLQDRRHGIDVMHNGKIIPNAIRVIQSFVLDEETTYPVDVPVADEEHLSRERKDLTYPADTWIIYARVLSDELWEDIKKGKYTGWSMAGLARVQEVLSKSLAA